MEQTLKRFSTFFVFLSICSHFFCCVLPLISSVSSLGASLGLFAINSPIVEWFVYYEVEIFAIAGVLITISGLAQYISYRIDCQNTGCEHDDCSPKKKWASKIFLFATTLYLVNLFVFLVLPHTHIH